MSTPYWGPDFDALAAFDPEIAGVVLDELDRLRSGLQLIASENFTSPAVLAALGSTLSQQVRRGLPRASATTAAARSSTGPSRSASTAAKELFGAEHANLQPHSGASANLAAYGAFLQPGDTVLGDGAAARRPPHPRHQGVSFSGKWFNAVHYGVRAGHRAHRLRPGPRPGPRAPARR